MGRLKRLKKIRIHREGTHTLAGSLVLILAVNTALYYGGTLVVGAGFGQPGFHELPVFVPYLLYRTIYRIPVGVYINQTHEYRYHDTAVVEVFVFLHFFHHYDFTVGTEVFVKLGQLTTGNQTVIAKLK